jgi:predicted secreted hydrolase
VVIVHRIIKICAHGKWVLSVQKTINILLEEPPYSDIVWWRMKLKKIDTIIIVVLIVVSTLFLYRADYISSILPNVHTPSPGNNNTTATPLPPEQVPTPPTSFLPAYRRDVSSEDEGVHFNELRISREWWYFNAVFNDSSSQLKDWAIAVSFNHMARGDLLGTNKPDLLVVSLFGNSSETFGGMINKEHYLGILKDGTLVADTPGVKVSFEKSWAEGSFPYWHVHAEDLNIDTSHTIVIDLDYVAQSLPLWVFGSRAFDKSESEVANYIILGCTVSGTVTIDGQVFTVKGIGSHEHSWTPNAITRLAIGGWDWFTLTLDNGWQLYVANYLPSPQAASSALARLDPFSTLVITTDHGSTVTELKDVNLKITAKDEKVFPLVKLPATLSLEADPSINPLYLISQSLLYGSKIKVQADIDISHATTQIWKFPTYLGMKIGYCSLDGTISWTDDDGDHEVPVHGIGVSWNMRALL